MSSKIHIRPNVPVYVTLADPEGDAANFDFELRVGRFSTTDGRVLVLPETATIAMNTVSPRAGEEIQITRVWSGKSHDREDWVICLSHRSEEARARQGEPEPPAPTKEAHPEPPTPIRRPVKPVRPTFEQPALFDRGTGTYGPMQKVVSETTFKPRPSIVRRQPPVVIPANVAVKEILEFIEADPGTQNWSGDVKQDLASTILIAEYRAKRIGLWEREK